MGMQPDPIAMLKEADANVQKRLTLVAMEMCVLMMELAVRLY